ncbi:hypothetical protein CV093_10710 [Oceanobacillus sp. 143]|nr:hypothetical protein CV093_10710 [Oceanobacillus sp. 143]
MEKMVLILFAFMLFIANGCENSSLKITEEEVEARVIEDHTGEIGEVKIISVSHKRGKYIVEWENRENCENRVDQIDDQNGDFIKGETTIC